MINRRIFRNGVIIVKNLFAYISAKYTNGKNNPILHNGYYRTNWDNCQLSVNQQNKPKKPLKIYYFLSIF